MPCMRGSYAHCRARIHDGFSLDPNQLAIVVLNAFASLLRPRERQILFSALDALDGLVIVVIKPTQTGRFLLRHPWPFLNS